MDDEYTKTYKSIIDILNTGEFRINNLDKLKFFLSKIIYKFISYCHVGRRASVLSIIGILDELKHELITKLDN